MTKVVKAKKVRAPVEQWVEIKREEDFISLFTNAQIVAAYGEYGTPADMPQKNRPWGEVYWKFSDGTWLAMHVFDNTSCDTCGFEIGKVYWKTVIK
jgi:hypothetical protein